MMFYVFDEQNNLQVPLAPPRGGYQCYKKLHYSFVIIIVQP